MRIGIENVSLRNVAHGDSAKRMDVQPENREVSCSCRAEIVRLAQVGKREIDFRNFRANPIREKMLRGALSPRLV